MFSQIFVQSSYTNINVTTHGSHTSGTDLALSILPIREEHKVKETEDWRYISRYMLSFF